MFPSSRSVYTVAISVGHNNQNMSVQVDMGSSDLVRPYLPCTSINLPVCLLGSCTNALLPVSQWLASKQCSTSACSSTGGRLYDPSTGTSTSAQFNIDYLAGSVSGPIYWDQVTLGGVYCFESGFGYVSVSFKKMHLLPSLTNIVMDSYSQPPPQQSTLNPWNTNSTAS